MESVEAATSEILSRPLQELYEFAKTRVTHSRSLWKFSNQDVASLYQKIEQVEQVKTIWQVDKAVNLHSFYYPTRLDLNQKIGTTSVAVSSVDQLRNLRPEEREQNAHILIEAIAGQGKSIFLRYLCSQELKRGKYIPVYFSFDKLQDGNKLLPSLYEEIELLGIEMSESLFELLAESGKLVLFLDGFDEIPLSYAAGVVRDLEYLSKKFVDVVIVVSSRPDSAVSRSSRFTTVRISKLGPADYPGLLEMSLPDSSQRKAILEALTANTSDVSGMITTPLMLALLVLVYKAERIIPATLAGFYFNIFYTLMERHDRSKPGFRRERLCKEVSYSKMLSLFEAFCFNCAKRQRIDFSVDEAVQIVDSSSSMLNIEVNSLDYLRDISSISNLLFEEGLKYHFIHGTVKEYYAASFISRRHEQAIRFYEHILEDDDALSRWYGIVEFLADIDVYRCRKYFLLPNVEKVLRHHGFDPEMDIDVALAEENIAPKRNQAFQDTRTKVSGTRKKPRTSFCTVRAFDSVDVSSLPPYRASTRSVLRNRFYETYENYIRTEYMLRSEFKAFIENEDSLAIDI